jgi:two-component system CheB/CheR fusion protein
VAVDVFFRTWPKCTAERAVCIVMSGTGSDGAVGLTRVKELGGIAMAQAPEDAAHDGMPLAAIATGMVDFVLPAVDMGRAADRPLAQRPADPAARRRGGRAFVAAAEPARADRPERPRRRCRKSWPAAHLHAPRLPHYKRATVLRRIERRLQVNRLTDLPAYRDFLRDHPEEAPLLLQDMLISVTSFFRDRDAFEALEREAMPQLIERKQPGEQVRAWVAGCATGEEAYSLSMLLREQADLQSKAAGDPGLRHRHRRARHRHRAQGCTRRASWRTCRPRGCGSSS